MVRTRSAYTLHELNAIIKSTISYAFPDAFWVIAEIAEAKCNQRGHCYLDLVEKEDEAIIAQLKATIWAYEYRRLSQKFQGTTGESLKPGMKIMLLVVITFHEVYGLSLNVKDIDPAYTLGEMALRKREVIERLKREGIADRNKGLALPMVPQKIAVISSPTAAGYEDFFRQLDENPYGYTFVHILFPALMQGQESEKSILSALDTIRSARGLFDVVVIIRGGGSAIDLSCFDGYALASQIAQFPLPVITGIGHEKDDTVSDIVAHTKMKTPTAVAEFLISGVRSFEERIMDIHGRMSVCVEGSLKDWHYRLNTLVQRLAIAPLRTASADGRLMILERDLKSHVRQLMHNENNRLMRMEQTVKLLDPAQILRRGYSITRHDREIVKDAARLKKGDVITTMFSHGTITSIVGKSVRGTKGVAREDEQEQTAYVLPGFD